MAINTQTKGAFEPIEYLKEIASIDDVFLALRHQGTEINVTDEKGRVFELNVRSLRHYGDGSGSYLSISGNAKLISTQKIRSIKGDVPSKHYEAFLNYGDTGGGAKSRIKLKK